MGRLSLMLVLLLFGLVGGTQAVGSEKKSEAQTEQPNIVFILTDDQRYDTLGYMPNLQSLVIDSGYTFKNAFVTTPLCCPSRVSIMTGQYAHEHGVETNSFPNGGALLANHDEHLAKSLQENGYKTALIGKYMNEYDMLIQSDDYGGAGFPFIPAGWDEWFGLTSRDLTQGATLYYGYSVNDNGTLTSYGFEPDDYSTDVITNRSVDFIETTGEQPFFLYVNYWAPHYQPIPAPRHDGYFDDLPPFYPPAYDEQDVSDKPQYVQDLPTLAEYPFYSDEQHQENRREYLETLLAVDEGVANIVAALDGMGELDNTIIIFASDNGWSWGEHRWWRKTVPYEESMRIPLVIKPAQGISEGKTLGRPIIMQDLTVTILAEAGVDLPDFPFDNVVGMDINTINDGNWRDDFLVEGWRKPSTGNETYVGVRSANWKYIEYVTGEEELYDLVNDPYELENVAYDSDYADMREVMRQRLDSLRP